MPAPNGSTFDGNPNAATPTTIGYRPGLSDFNGAACVDVTATPPNPTTQPTAACWNTFGAELVSCGKMIAVANIAINAAASPTVQSWATAANLITVNPFTTTRVGAGHYQHTWPTNTFPITGWPKAYLNAALGAHNYAISAVNMASPPVGMSGVDVYTVQDGALADLNYNLDLFLMPQFSAFTSFGFLEFSSQPSLHEQMYDLLPQLWGTQHDMTQVPSYEESKRYAVAAMCAIMLTELNHAGNQANPLTAYDLLPLLENDFLVSPGPNDGLQTRQNAVAAAMLLPGGAKASNVVNVIRMLVGAAFLAYVPNPAGQGNQTVYPASPGNGPGAFKDVRVPAKFLQLVDPVVQTGVSSWVGYQALDTSTLPTITWSPSSTFSVGQLVLPTLAASNGFYFACSVAGTTGTSQPAWPSVVGETVVDGTVTWTCVSTIAPALVTGDVIVVDGGNTNRMEKVVVSTTILPSTTWTPATAFNLGQQMLPSIANTNGFEFLCTTAGTTGATEPVWPTTIGSSVTDGSIVWLCLARVPNVTPGVLYFLALFQKAHDPGAPITTGNMPYWWSTQRLNLIVLSGASASDPNTRSKIDHVLAKVLRTIDQWAIVTPSSTTATGGTLGPLSAGTPMGTVPIGTIPFTNSN